MPNIVWWILGLAAVGGAAFYYSDSGKKIFKRDACIEDLPKNKKADVLEAIKSKDLKLLTSFADSAEKEGWKCAAKEIRSNIESISKSTPVNKCPTSDQVDIAIKDIESGKLSIEAASKLVSKLESNGCKDQKDSIATAIEKKKFAVEKEKFESTSLSKDTIVNLIIGNIEEMVSSVPEPDKSVIIDILKSARSTSDLAHFKYDSGRVSSYADVANKYKAYKAEGKLRDLAKSITEAVSKLADSKFSSENELRAKSEWPGIMDLPNSDLGNTAKAAALCLHKVGDLFKREAFNKDKPAVVVNLKQAIPGCAVNVDKLESVTSEIDSKYGSTFSQAVTELKIITNSLRSDLLT